MHLTEQEKDRAAKIWNGTPPACCTGKCEFSGILMEQCNHCEWDDVYCGTHPGDKEFTK